MAFSDPIPLPAQSILLYQMFGTLAGQRIITTFHYRVEDAPSPAIDYRTYMQRFLSFMFGGGGHVDLLLPFLPDNYTCNYHQVQPIYPTRMRYVKGIVDAPGTRGATANTANIAQSVRRIGQYPDRHGVGRVQLPIATADVIGGNIDYTNIGLAMGVWIAMAENQFTTLVDPLTYAPVLYDAKLPAPSPRWNYIMDYTGETTARTMHRRTVRLGE